MQPQHYQEGMDESESPHLAFRLLQILDESLPALLSLKSGDLGLESGLLGGQIDILRALGLAGAV